VKTGAANPFRYRGYYYDIETGFYYLNSRYYDPAVGRFINADSYATTGQGVLGSNMFAYCLNNPVNRVDQSGSLSTKLNSIPDDTVGGKLDGEYPTAPIGESDRMGVGEPSHGGMCGTFTIIYFEKIEDCVNNWFDSVIPLTADDGRERGAIIKKKTIEGKVYYYMDRTYVGEYGTVWYGFVLGYVFSFNLAIVGFAHTHMSYGDNQSYDRGPSNYDLSLFNMEGIERQFIGNVWNGNDKPKYDPYIPYNRYEFDASGNTIRIYP